MSGPSGYHTASYRPPQKFRPAVEGFFSPRLESLISGQNLKGKQLWYITASDSSSLSHLSRGLGDRSDTSPTELGYSFELLDESRGLPRYVTAPCSSIGAYKPFSCPLKGCMNVQELRELSDPNAFTGQVEGTSKGRAKTKPIPRQPEGLRMRHRPLGDVTSEVRPQTRPMETDSSRTGFRSPFTTLNDGTKHLQRGTDVQFTGGGHTTSGEKRKKRRRDEKEA